MEDFCLNNFVPVKRYDTELINMTVKNNSATADNAYQLYKASSFETVIVMCLALVVFVIFHFENSKSGIPLQSIDINYFLSAKTVSRLIALFMLVLVLPMVIILMILGFIYKWLCALVLKSKDRHFVKLLDSFDVFWSLEDDASKSVIHVLGIIESDCSQLLANNIKQILSSILPNEVTDKIFYRRKEGYGFYYWRKNSCVDMNQYVKIVDHPEKTEQLNMDDLGEIMSAVANQSLPYDNEGLFQILITKHRMGSDIQERGEYGIIFRIHHAVGDGVALIEFLCKTLADDTEASCSFHMFNNNNPESYHTDYYRPGNIMAMIAKLCGIPLCFVDGILREPDNNDLHGPPLNGIKIFKWMESGDELLQKIKEIKSSYIGLKFSDILAVALSNGLYNFFSKKSLSSVPNDIATILPVRLSRKSLDGKKFKLENDFSVTILDMPIRKGDVNAVKRTCQRLRKSADPITNYYFLKLVGSVLPNYFLQPLLKSGQATLVFSNMPGPERLSICGGNALKSLVFFVPNKGTTGLGVTALSYGGDLRFAAMADSALVPNRQNLAIILDGMVEAINSLHHKYAGA